MLKRLSVPLLALFILVSCGGSSSGSGSKIVATLGTVTPSNVATLSEAGLALTPAVYKLALVNFWLINSAGEDVNIINPDATSPNFTEERPLIIDFTSNATAIELLESATIPAGTYTGYKMQFLYIEMNLPTAFHVPNSAWETEYTGTVADILDTELNKNFRLYFNAYGKFWKRDFIAELNEGDWYWLRRQVEDNLGHRNFFIPISTNTHPVGGAGSDSTIDLFNDPDFWGTGDLDDATNPIVVGTHNAEVGGLNIVLPEPLVVSGGETINLLVDITNTMMYGSGTAPAGVTFFDDTLDLGPGYLTDNYGDLGLHPALPKFSLSVATSEIDTTKVAYQLPVTCIESDWTEPYTCYVNYCTENPTDLFCTNYQED